MRKPKKNNPAYRRAYYLKHREFLIRQTQEWAANQTPEQREATARRKKEWAIKQYPRLKERHLAKANAFYHVNREKVLEQKRLRRLSNPEAVRAVAIKTQQKNKERIRLRAAEWIKNNPERYQKNREAYKTRRNELCKLRRAENPQRKLSENFRSRISMILKRVGVTKSNHSFDFLGCTGQFFKDFLEHQFLPGMTWQNYGEFWNVDHVIPISRFNLQDPDQVKRAFHYSNCRPYLVDDNSSKSDTLPPPHQALLL